MANTEFRDQVDEVQVVIVTEPRTYVKWTNTTEGRDKHDCYERIKMGNSIIYRNTYNRNSDSVTMDNPFWRELEELYIIGMRKL